MMILIQLLHLNATIMGFFGIVTDISTKTLTYYINQRFSNQQRLQDWHTRLHRLRITSDVINRDWFTGKYVVYAKISLHRHECDVGMTTVGIINGEQARCRKLKQLRRGTLVCCEPALRWWNKTHS